MLLGSKSQPSTQRVKFTSAANQQVATGPGRVIHIDFPNNGGATAAVLLQDGVDASGRVIGKIVVPNGDTREIRPEAMYYQTGLFVTWQIGGGTEFCFIEYVPEPKPVKA